MVELTFPVTEQDTAIALGSGEVAVLATPRLLAWMEAATVAAVADRLPEGTTTVGYRIDLVHFRPSPVGESVTVRAELVSDDERRFTFRVTATGPAGEAIAQGEVKRSSVEIRQFMTDAGR